MRTTVAIVTLAALALRLPSGLAQETIPAEKTLFALRSPRVEDGGALPREFTGDGDSATLPLEWSGAPEDTKSYALIMHHIDPEGHTKWYWILYNIPASIQRLPKNVEGIGTLGNNSVSGRTEYAPPHSKGPGPKTYVYTVYALSTPVQLSVAPAGISRDVLLKAVQGHVLATAELRVTYTRSSAGEEPDPPQQATSGPPRQPQDRDTSANRAGHTPAPAGPGPFDRPARNRGGGRSKGSDGDFLGTPDGSWPVASVIVARPGVTTIDVSVLAAHDLRGRVEYWRTGTDKVLQTPERDFNGDEPVVIRLSELAPDAAYRYHLSYAEARQHDLKTGPEYGFHTQRAPGSAFTFEVQGDSHPERPQQCDPALYAQVLRSAAADHPDFYVTIGDDFSVDTLGEVTADALERIYLGQRRYLGLVGHSAPLFLVNGNHEQAAQCNLDGTANNVAVWAQTCREKYFSQPAPEGIYTGDREPVEHIGPLRDYYAWTWGDALFVVIDPYWHSKKPVDNVFGGGKKNRDLWDVTLGAAQYRWLKETLEKSDAKYKFVFTHHVLGTGRGGVERAGLFEWGGRNNRGNWEFEARRPGWKQPIHQLMASTGVTIFFQGHDHLFCKQELDGVVYQTLPEPADPSYTLYNKDAYLTGDALPNSGRVRVTVSPEKVTVEYVRSYLPEDVNAERGDGKVAYSYVVTPRAASSRTDEQKRLSPQKRP
ncbi:MAG TPA: metallophosphoesterase [Phycisphaerae bacterium]|nr:metallophosphoesterase [Phycisphaerae bacterium]HNU44775.1 metallophosphoesterase [Phycisphaerae bacterium]